LIPKTDIRQVPVEDTYQLRQIILRPGRPVSSCQFPNDWEAGVRHFAAYRDNLQIGIVSVYPVPVKAELAAWQIRAMATQPWVRRQGYGLALLQAVENYVLCQSGRLVWCNARTHAVGFYQRAGYSLQGEPFLIPGVGEHFFMQKQLSG